MIWSNTLVRNSQGRLEWIFYSTYVVQILFLWMSLLAPSKVIREVRDRCVTLLLRLRLHCKVGKELWSYVENMQEWRIAQYQLGGIKKKGNRNVPPFLCWFSSLNLMSDKAFWINENVDISHLKYQNYASRILLTSTRKKEKSWI